MNEPAYTNEFKKPVFSVNNLAIKKVKGSMSLYELQLNGEYYQISEDQIKVIDGIIYMPDNVGVTLG